MKKSYGELQQFLDSHVGYEKKLKEKREENWSWSNHGGNFLERIWRKRLKIQVVNHEE